MDKGETRHVVAWKILTCIKVIAGASEQITLIGNGLREAMDQTLVTRLFDRGMIEQAFPLVSARTPSMTLDRWTRFAVQHVAPRAAELPRGLMAVQNQAGYILGMFAFAVREDLDEGRVLSIENVIVPNMPGRDMIWSAVADSIDRLATMNGCRAILADLPRKRGPGDEEAAWAAPFLARCGYVLTVNRALKRLRPEPVSAGVFPAMHTSR
jgi:hypothetical protein